MNIDNREQWFAINISTKTVSIGFISVPALRPNNSIDLLSRKTKEEVAQNETVRDFLVKQYIKIEQDKDGQHILTIDHTNVDLLLTPNSIITPAQTSDNANIELSKLYDSKGDEALDWSNPDAIVITNLAVQKLFTNEFVESADIEERILFDQNSNPSVDWDNRKLLNSEGQSIVDYQSESLKDSQGAISIDWGSRTLKDSGGEAICSFDQTFDIRITNDDTNRPLTDGFLRFCLNNNGTLSIIVKNNEGIVHKYRLVEE